jgi:hypothetical protein
LAAAEANLVAVGVAVDHLAHTVLVRLFGCRVDSSGADALDPLIEIVDEHRVQCGARSLGQHHNVWAARQPGFRNPRFRPVSVGGLSGIVADLRLARGWSKTCIYSDGLPVQPLITGLGVSYLDHNVLPGQVTRLYLLDYLEGALAIEVVDIKDANHLPDYTRLVRRLRFGT